MNKVDDEADAVAARAVAEGVLERAAVPPVLLARLIADDPVVEVVE